MSNAVWETSFGWNVSRLSFQLINLILCKRPALKYSNLRMVIVVNFHSYESFMRGSLLNDSLLPGVPRCTDTPHHHIRIRNSTAFSSVDILSWNDVTGINGTANNRSSLEISMKHCEATFWKISKAFTRIPSLRFLTFGRRRFFSLFSRKRRSWSFISSWSAAMMTPVDFCLCLLKLLAKFHSCCVEWFVFAKAGRWITVTSLFVVCQKYQS